MFEAVIGAIPHGLMVCHSCDNAKCINPEHLWAGTNQENQLDKIAKGRAKGGSMPNETNPFYKFTREDVEQMRIVKKDTGMTGKELSKIFKISEGHFSHIINRRVRLIGMSDSLQGE